MKVILTQELKGRGGEGDVIDVARGFAANYLLPRGIAIEATPGNLKQLEQRRHNIEKREATRITDANTFSEALDGKSVTIEMLVGEAGRLFGSVTAQMVEEAIKEQLGIEVDRRKIELRGAIKTLGSHPIEIAVYREIKASVIVEVVDSQADASAEEAAAEVLAEVEAEEAKEVAEAVEAAEAAAEAAEEAAEETAETTEAKTEEA